MNPIRTVLVRVLPLSIEAVVLVLVSALPWALGSSEPASEFIFLCGTSLLLVLWGVRIALERAVLLSRSAAAVCFALLCLGGARMPGVSPRCSRPLRRGRYGVAGVCAARSG